MISSVYNYYMSEYGLRPNDKHSAHKKSELRDVYNNIIKLSKSSPVYKLDVSEASQKLAIDIKENARSLSDITDDLTDAENGAMTFKSIAESDNEDVVGVKYIGDNTGADENRSFTIAVKQLATPQVNTGNYLNPRARSLFTGTYTFDVNISSITYELQFSVKDEDTNIDIQNRLVRLINKSNIGLNAGLVSNAQGQNALSLTSNMTGVGDRPVIFTVTDDSADDNVSALSGAVSALGLNNTTSYPSNAVFDLNGDEKISSANTFTVDREFEVTLKDVSAEGEAVTIGLKQNMDSLIDSLHELADSYNRLAVLAGNGTGTGSRRLYSDLAAISSEYSDVLTSNGLSVSDKGLLAVDDEVLRQSSVDGRLLDTLSQIGRFKTALQNKAKSIVINPMEYVDKVIVNYKNPRRLTADPYTTSIYTGMMYNGYC